MNKLKINSLLLLVLLLTGCGDYQKLLKSTDYELKYSRAKEYYQGKKYLKSSTLLEEVAPLFKGTDRAEEANFLLANSYYGLKNYDFAGTYFNQMTKMFPNGKYTEEAMFMRAMCYYKASPNEKLDQANTRYALEAFDAFLSVYPKSSKLAEVQGFMNELNDKQAYKSYINAKLYLALKNLNGNNYLAAVIEAENCIKDFPDTKYREELSFLILEGKHMQAYHSIPEKLVERYRLVADEYYSFLNEYPESKFKKDADRIFKDTQRYIK